MILEVAVDYNKVIYEISKSFLYSCQLRCFGRRELAVHEIILHSDRFYDTKKSLYKTNK